MSAQGRGGRYPKSRQKGREVVLLLSSGPSVTCWVNFGHILRFLACVGGTQPIYKNKFHETYHRDCGINADSSYCESDKGESKPLKSQPNPIHSEVLGVGKQPAWPGKGREVV